MNGYSEDLLEKIVAAVGRGNLQEEPDGPHLRREPLDSLPRHSPDRIEQ